MSQPGGAAAPQFGVETQLLFGVMVEGSFSVGIYRPSASYTPSTATSDTFPDTEESFLLQLSRAGADKLKQTVFKGIKAAEAFVYSVGEVLTSLS
ncbi:hypothetical protein STEG23_031448 [Scotinomys teguina]